MSSDLPKNHVMLMKNRFEGNSGGSIRRSPAFRLENKPILSKPSDKIPNVSDQEYSTLSATLKKVLRKPLPSGAPPKKPPRLFESPSKELNIVQEFDRAGASMRITNNKNDNSFGKSKSTSSNYIGCSEISRCDTSFQCNNATEPIYSEPFNNKCNNNNQISPPNLLHYMVCLHSSHNFYFH